MHHRQKFYQTITENVVGKHSLRETYELQKQALDTLIKLTSNQNVENTDFPMPLDIEPYPTQGILVGELALSALAISHGDFIQDILFDQKDLYQIIKRLNRADKFLEEHIEDEFEDDIVEEQSEC